MESSVLLSLSVSCSHWNVIDLSTRPPLLLLHFQNFFKQLFNQRFLENLPYLTLHVWHLDLWPNYLKKSQSQWQIELRHLRDFYQEESAN